MSASTTPKSGAVVPPPVRDPCPSWAWWCRCESASTTAKSGAVVPPPVRDLAVLVEEIQSVRYCPMHEVDARVMRLALRLANAEGLLYEMQQGARK